MEFNSDGQIYFLPYGSFKKEKRNGHSASPGSIIVVKGDPTCTVRVLRTTSSVAKIPWVTDVVVRVRGTLVTSPVY